MIDERPTFRGLLVYRHLEHRFSLLYPLGWSCEPLTEEQGGGVACCPEPGNHATALIIRGAHLEVSVEPDDLPVIQEGFLEGVRSLPDAQIEQEEASATGRLLSLEARHTYRDGEAVRKRWLRLLYQGKTQVTLIAQGASPEAFAFWLPMFTTAMRTVKFGDWWSEVTGREWLPSLAAEEGADEPAADEPAADEPANQPDSTKG